MIERAAGARERFLAKLPLGDGTGEGQATCGVSSVEPYREARWERAERLGAAAAAGDSFNQTFQASLISSGLLGDNGRSVFGPWSCRATASGTTFEDLCCSGSTSPCPSPGAAYTCTNGACTCTVGKNKGNSFTGPPSPPDAWDVCNL